MKINNIVFSENNNIGTTSNYNIFLNSYLDKHREDCIQFLRNKTIKDLNFYFEDFKIISQICKTDPVNYIHVDLISLDHVEESTVLMLCTTFEIFKIK